MWEMWLGCFVKQKHKPHVSKFRSDYLAKGLGKIAPGKNHVFGNKGGVAQSFMIQSRLFSFIAVHLKHDFVNYDKRNKMAGQLIKGLKLTALQRDIGGLESDQISDFAFFLGDTNYRLNTDEIPENNAQLHYTGKTTFHMSKLNKTNVVTSYMTRVQTKYDQLFIA